MGFFDVHCAHSGLALVADTRLVPLLETDASWTPLAAPLQGTYDRLGGIDEPEGLRVGWKRDLRGIVPVDPC